MQNIHCEFKVSFQNVINVLYRIRYCIIDGIAIIGTWFLQYIRDHLISTTRMADADTHARESVVAQTVRYIA